MASSRLDRRTVLKSAAATAAVGAIGFPAPAVLGQAKPFAGVTLNGACFQHVFHTYLKDYIPEFEEQTGMKVNFDAAGLPGLQPARWTSSCRPRARPTTFCNVTFIYTGRWIGAGWLTPLDEFVSDPNLTPADWDPADFRRRRPGAALQDAEGKTYGFAWEAGAMIMGIARGDLLEQAGLELPTTFDELVQVCEAIDEQEGVAAFVADKLHHWNWIPYLMGSGGGVFRDPPDDLMPDPRHARGRRGGRVLRQPADQVRPVRRPVVHRRPGDARPARRPRQHPDPGDRLDDAARQARGEQGQGRPRATR